MSRPAASNATEVRRFRSRFAVRTTADRFGRGRCGRGGTRAAITAVPVERDLPVAGADRQAAIRAEGHRGWPGVEAKATELDSRGGVRDAPDRGRRRASPAPNGQTLTVGCKAQVADRIHGGQHGQKLVGDCIPDLSMVADSVCQQCSLGVEMHESGHTPRGREAVEECPGLPVPDLDRAARGRGQHIAGSQGKRAQHLGLSVDLACVPAVPRRVESHGDRCRRHGGR